MTKLEKVKACLKGMEDSMLACVIANFCLSYGETDYHWLPMEEFDSAFDGYPPSQVAYLVAWNEDDFYLNDEYFRTTFVEDLDSAGTEEVVDDIRNNLDEYAQMLYWYEPNETGCVELDAILESEED